MPARVAMQQISKIYPNGVVANHKVDFAVEKGEIHALVGENGAGKSTLMKLLYGLEQPTHGAIFLEGRRVEIANPQRAIHLGIGMVHQNFMLAPSFTIAENVVLGNEPRKGRLVDHKRAIAITAALSAKFGLQVDPTARIEATPVGMRQRAEILKTLFRGADLLILDEPTAVLTPQETDELFWAVRNLVDQGKTVIFITHKLGEVKEIADRVTVMRHGEVAGRVATREVTEADLARMMVGRAVLLSSYARPAVRGKVVAAVHNLGCIDETGRPVLRNVTFAVHAGEILGVAGVEGNGQSELVEVMAGLRAVATGEIRINGKAVQGASVREMRANGVAHIPEDRLANGVALDASIAENLVVDRYHRPPFTRYGVLWPRSVRQHATALMQQFDIRGAGPGASLRSLSGGNQQKVVAAREFSAAPVLLIAAQPTRGVDIGATEFVHGQLLAKRNAGAAVLLVSADLSEVLRLADRIVVMVKGEIAGILQNGPQLTEETLGVYMLGRNRPTP
jgi:simple sugar transport system ATP-binding protein